jgi:hypothetical protein
MSWEGHITCMGNMRNACRSSVGIPDRKREFGKPRYRREGT